MTLQKYRKPNAHVNTQTTPNILPIPLEHTDTNAKTSAPLKTIGQSLTSPLKTLIKRFNSGSNIRPCLNSLPHTHACDGTEKGTCIPCGHS